MYALNCIKIGTAIDPACGTAGFLISSCEHIREKYESKMTSEQWAAFDSEMFTGYDTDPTMLRISAMNLMLHSITKPDISYRDSVSKQNEISDRFDVILAIIWTPFSISTLGLQPRSTQSSALDRMVALIALF